MKSASTSQLNLMFAKRVGGPQELALKLIEASREGHLCIESDEAHLMPESPYIIRDQNRLYLAQNYFYETSVLNEVLRLQGTIEAPTFLVSECNAEQQRAIQMALSHTLSIITGGPGTGKTFVARHLAKALSPSASVIFTAPTGKAASRLKEIGSTYRVGTLHSLLGIQSERDFQEKTAYLKADLIVVDECSMIDARLFSFLLRSICKGSRVVLLGDSDQLPPIESGSFFLDLQDLIPTARLTQSVRSNSQICQLGALIQEEKVDDIPLQEPTKNFLEIAKDRFDTEGEFRFLSALREGPFGVSHINSHLFEHEVRKEHPKIPILIRKTSYSLGLYNGELGYLFYVNGKPNKAEFPGKEPLDATLLPAYELAYCLSVHKSQGSEFRHIALFLPRGSEHFGKEALYTAVTRAKESVTLYGDRATLKACLERSSKKASGLRTRLHEKCHPREQDSPNKRDEPSPPDVAGMSHRFDDELRHEEGENASHH